MRNLSVPYAWLFIPVIVVRNVKYCSLIPNRIRVQNEHNIFSNQPHFLGYNSVNMKMRLWPLLLCIGQCCMSQHHSPGLLSGFEGLRNQEKYGNGIKRKQQEAQV